VTTLAASVLIPTRAPGAAIERVLSAVYRQQPAFPFPFDVVVVDSGSSPEELGIMRRFPLRLHQIDPREFGHGRTRNLLGSLATGEVLVYLSQDAEPASGDWLARLVAPLADSSVAGAYARQLPRPDASPLMRFFLAEMYGPAPARRGLRAGQVASLGNIFFSNVSSAIRRDVWQTIPFRADAIMSEDQYWAYDVLRAGFQVVYEPAAQVWHSHNYSLRTLYERNWLSGRSLRGLIGDSTGGVARRGLAYLGREVAYLVGHGQAAWLPYMVPYELARSLGFALGTAGWPRKRAT